jgi:hypothetical protein
MDDRESQINDLIDDFDFQRVHIAMTALDWQWQTTEGNGHAVPSIAKLKGMARHLLRESIKNKVVASGGFVAKYHPKVDNDSEYFSLQFVLTEKDSFED